MRPSKSLACLALSAALVATACQSGARRQEALAYVERPVEQLYNQAAAELDSRDYQTAILLFNEVERQHPYSEWARRSMVMTSFANYSARNYDEAIASSQRYLALHPGGSEADYAYYLIAASYFEQIVDVGRDQKTTELARNALLDVSRRFPDSQYARDASVKIDMVNDQLAGKEMEVGRWYLRHNQTLAAVNRFKTVVDDYDTTSHAPEALHRMVESYLTLGLTGEATKSAAVLGHNYPQSDWYRMSYRLLTNKGVDLEAEAESKRTMMQKILPGGK
ncbi:MAG: outer membrane protein assembly factor BamD [Hyphomonas sp.]